MSNLLDTEYYKINKSQKPVIKADIKVSQEESTSPESIRNQLEFRRIRKISF